MTFGLSSIATAAAFAILGSTSARATIVTKLDTDPKRVDFIAYPTGEILADQTSTYELEDDFRGDLFASGTLRSTVFRETDGTLSFLYRVAHFPVGDSSIEYEGYFIDGFAELAFIDAYIASPNGEQVGFGPGSARYAPERNAYHYPYKYSGEHFDVLIKTTATEFSLTGIFTITGDADGRIPVAPYDEDALAVHAPATGTPIVPLPPAVIPGALMIGGIVGSTLLRHRRARRAERAAATGPVGGT